MIESPVVQELIADCRREDVVRFLVARFGADAKELEGRLKDVDEDRLDELFTLAATCPGPDAFREQLPR